MSLPSLSNNQSSDSSSDSLDDLIFPTIPMLGRPTGSIEVPFEIVAVCRRNDLLLHPGGYRLPAQALRTAGRSQSQSLLARELRAIVKQRAQVDPMIRPRPTIRFLVETNGGATYWAARRQILFSGLDWPMSLHVAGPQETQALHRELW
jgi:hypothetical protein